AQKIQLQAGGGRVEERKSGRVEAPDRIVPSSPLPLFRSSTPLLPTGTVTFLLTDIEGSTAAWEREGEAFRVALERHHALLRQEFRRHGGHHEKETGDGFLVAFHQPSAALACAVAAQRALSIADCAGTRGAGGGSADCPNGLESGVRSPDNPQSAIRNPQLKV